MTRPLDRPRLAAGTRRVLELLTDGLWHTAAQIEEACDVTAHSRLADLRAADHVIEKRRNPGATGRRMFSYRLIATAEQLAEARAARTVAPAAAVFEEDALEDAGWRDLYAAGREEPLPPPHSAGRLDAGVAS